MSGSKSLTALIGLVQAAIPGCSALSTTMQNPQVLAHLIAQTKENITLLASLNEISSQDADLILSKLPQGGLSAPATNYGFATSARSPTPVHASNNASVKAKAIWGYNEDFQQPQDLTFSAGDIIEILDDKDPNWWTGRHRGKEGIFPSSYADKLAVNDRTSRPVPPPPVRNFNKPPPPGPPVHQAQYSAPHMNGPMYPAPPQGYPGPGPMGPPPPQSYYAPPPPPQGPYPPYGAPPPPGPPQQQVVVEEEPKKKKGFLGGGMGNTLAHSAVGGVGFGAGSAAAGGLISSIF